MLEACRDDIVQRGLLPVLDATPAGEQVYRPLGFEPMVGLTRWQGLGGGRDEPALGLRMMTAADLPSVVGADAVAFGAPRGFLIESLFGRAPALAFVRDDMAGFAVARLGRLATQIGPIVAADEAGAVALLEIALNAASGPVFLDIVDRWAALARLLRQRGFTVQRPFTRMALRRRAPLGDSSRLFVVAGPEFG
jgi:hypothetical protein